MPGIQKKKVVEDVEAPAKPTKLKRQKAIVAKPSKPAKPAGKAKVVGVSAWQNHLKEFRTSNPTLSLKESMIRAKKTYLRN